MPHIRTSPDILLNRLIADHPQFSFVTGANDHWDSNGVISYTATTSECSLLHELAHALLGHTGYALDIELVRMERSAWDYARRTLAPKYDVTVTEADAEDALDTYRDWLHNRSLCPHCNLSGLQKTDQTFGCVVCGTSWRANIAKTCALRRYRVPALK